MAENFKLPASSMDELLKVIQAYADAKEGTALTLDEVAQATGMARTTVSANNGFLVQVGLIGEGNKKAATDIGRSLGRAYRSKIVDEIERIWKQIVLEDDFLNRMLSAVRIRGGMDKTSFINHIIYSSGQNDKKTTRTGAGAVIDIMKSVTLIREEDGKITVVETVGSSTPSEGNIKPANNVDDVADYKKMGMCADSTRVVININVSCGVGELDELAVKIKNLMTCMSE